jgi:3-methylfumaryl-CoA hydratase
MAADFKDWIGKTETVEDIASSVPLAGLSALLDYDVPPRRDGELPPLSHWLYFLDHARQSQLGPDGHARRGGFLPPVELPRRMWAGSRIVFHAPVAIGAAMTRRSTVAAITEKTGASGAMVFVTVRHEISSVGELCIVDEHDIVYRQEPKPGAKAPEQKREDRVPQYARTVTPDPVLLFRYSALTFNSHRIHYDRDYCRDVEGYPGLVVHGPLTATLLMDHFLRHNPKARIARFEFRSQSPLFDIAPFELCADGDALWVRGPSGETAMTAKIETR